MIKLVIASALVASALAALPPLRTYQTKLPVLPSPAPYSPLPVSYNPQPGRPIAILRQSSDSAPDGSSYNWSYETENGISAEESGSLVGSGPEAALAAHGSYQYTAPDGSPVQVTYVADENGFQPTGNVVPQIPEAIQRSIQYNLAHPEPQNVVSGVRTF